MKRWRYASQLVESILKLKDAIQKLGKTEAVEYAKLAAEEESIDWGVGISTVFNAIISNPDLAPANVGGINDGEEEVIRRWIVKYKNGIKGRASVRKSNLPRTVADPIIEKIIGTRVTALTESDLRRIMYAHRLGMSAENILGSILEEYLASKLVEFNWHCAWGETVKSVDFVHTNGGLLQIKNRSNSENSSSSAIRKGTDIRHWFRIKADRIEYNWDSLNAICGTDSLNEQGFVSFVKDIINKNPDCLAVEAENPWKQKNSV